MSEDFNESTSSKDEDQIFEVNQFNLRNFLDVVIRRKKFFIILFLTFFSISIANLTYKRLTKPVYRGSFILMISDPFIGERKSDGGRFSLENLALNQSDADIATLISYLQSPKLLKNIAEKNDISPSSLVGRIKISLPPLNKRAFGKQSQTLLVVLEGDDIKEMENILSKLSNEYVISASLARKKQLSEGIKFLDQQKPIILERVSKSQKNLEDFRLENKTLNPVQEGEALKRRIGILEAEIINLNSENTRLESIQLNLENGILFSQGITKGGIVNDLQVFGVINSDQLLLNEILDVKTELSKAQSTYKDSSIIVQTLKEKLRQLEPLLIQNQKSAAKAAIALNTSLIKATEKRIIELQSLFIPLPKIITRFSDIKLELKGLEENLIMIVKTTEKLKLELSQEILPWKIISDPSVEGSPIKPDINRNLIYISFFTLLFTSLLTLLIDKLDNVYHSANEVGKFINLPILGLVPFFNFEPKDLLEIDENEKETSINNLFEDQNYFIFQETFRNIFTAINFSNIDKEIKTLSLTSTIPEEGKSLIAIFLAMNISEISKKILLVDADLRRPSLHKKLNVDNVTGLSNCLVNSKSSWKDVVTKHYKYENFSYMTAGKIPPNPVRILESKRMKDLVEDIKSSNEYDLIIFDCPPILGLSDSMIISNIVDGVILNVSLNKVDRTLSLETLKKLKVLKTPILGLIVNSVSKSKAQDPTRNKYFTNYMPLETSQRYGINKSVDEKSSNQSNSQKNFIKELNDIFKKFKTWLNE